MLENKDLEPWVEFENIWSTKSKFMSWVRGGIRSGLWKRHPVKLEYMKSKTVLVENTNPRSMKAHPKVKACACEICGEVVTLANIEVDHVKGNHSLKSMDDLRSFIEGMIMVRFEDLQMVCKPCHKIKTHAEKKGLSFEDARIDKQMIDICKGSAEAVKSWLVQRGITPAGTVGKRKEQVLQALIREVK